MEEARRKRKNKNKNKNKKAIEENNNSRVNKYTYVLEKKRAEEIKKTIKINRTIEHNECILRESNPGLEFGRLPS